MNAPNHVLPTLLAAVFLLLVSAIDVAAEITVEVQETVHPVLIRKDRQPIADLVIKHHGPEELRLQEVLLTLAGDAPVEDLELVELMAVAADGKLVSGPPLVQWSTTTLLSRWKVDHPLPAGEHRLRLLVKLRPTANLTHRVAVRCEELVTSQGTVEPVWGKLTHRIGVAVRQAGEDQVHTYRIPALTTTPRGTLLCVYDVRRRAGRDLQEDIDIGLSRSTDGGQTWEPLSIIMDMGIYNGRPQAENGCSDPGIIVDPQTGEIFVFAVWMWGRPGQHQWNDRGSEPGFEIGTTAQFLMVRSVDDGRTWSAPVNLTRPLKQEAWWLLAPSPQQGIALPDGTLVMPIQGRDAEGTPFATIMLSSDHGVTWQVQTPAYSGGNECQVVRLGDESLMLNMRNDRERFRAVMTTADRGRSWIEHPTHRNTLIEPNCNGSLLRVDYDDAGVSRHVLLFANPHTQQGRTHHTVQISFDDGLTWPASHHVLLDAGKGFGYPSLTRVDADHIGIVYEGSQSHLMFEKLALRGLLAGM
jgi:sialidase-1